MCAACSISVSAIFSTSGDGVMTAMSPCRSIRKGCLLCDESIAMTLSGARVRFRPTTRSTRESRSGLQALGYHPATSNQALAQALLPLYRRDGRPWEPRRGYATIVVGTGGSGERAIAMRSIFELTTEEAYQIIA